MVLDLPTAYFYFYFSFPLFANMFSFLRSWVFHFSQPPPLEDDQPPPLKDDPTDDPSRTVYPLHTVPDPYHYEYHGPFDVAPTDMPNFIDILLSDVKEEDLHHDISTALGSGYLSETPHLRSPHATVDGIMFGRNNRVMFPLVVRVGNSRSYVLHFLYDSGCPFTFLSREVCGVLEPKHFTCNH